MDNKTWTWLLIAAALFVAWLVVVGPSALIVLRGVL